MAPRSKFLVLVDDADRAVLKAQCPQFVSFMEASGVNFARAYSEPECASSRADYLTGRVVRRHGVDRVPSKGGELMDTETTIAQHPRIAPRPTALFGKWHVNQVADLDAPNRFGFDHFSGHMENLTGRTGNLDGHNVWPNTVNGAPEFERFEYSTTAIVNDFLAWLSAQGSKSVFAVLSLSALHAPYTRPPGSSLPTVHPLPEDDGRPWWEEMAAFMDTELARMLAAMSPEQRDGADWIFASDNGAPGSFGGGKGKLTEDGIGIPLWMRSPECIRPGRSWNHPVQLTDIYRTFTGSGGDDSVDMIPILRSVMVTEPRTLALAENVIEGVDPDPDVVQIAGIEQQFKARQTDADPWTVFDLLEDPEEETDLVPGGLAPDAAAALARIQAAWAAIPTP